jgi:anti-anti-sigma factor
MFVIDHTEALDGKVTIVEVKGPLNGETSAAFEEYINKLLDMGKAFILLNAKNLEYISSDGIGLILYIQKKISSNNGYLILFNNPNEIDTLYTLLGFNKIFTIVKTREDAFQIIEKQIELRDSSVPTSHEDAFISEISQTYEPLSLEEISEEKSPEVPDTSEGSIEFDTPIISECSECKSLIRIKRSGTYLCPDCHKEFTVQKDKTIIF